MTASGQREGSGEERMTKESVGLCVVCGADSLSLCSQLVLASSVGTSTLHVISLDPIND